MTNKLLRRWCSVFTHSAFSSKSKSSQRLVIAEYSQGFLRGIFMLSASALVVDLAQVLRLLGHGLHLRPHEFRL